MNSLLTRRQVIRLTALLLISGGLLLSAPLIKTYLDKNAALAAPATMVQRPELVQSADLIAGIPQRVVVPAVSIDLPVIRGTYNAQTGTWTLTDTSAQFADQSVPLNNQKGNTLIYAHATSNLFGRLANLPAGSVATVYAENGSVFTYRLVKREAVTPSHTQVITATGAPQLVLQTCSGSFSQNRELYYFRLEKITQP